MLYPYRFQPILMERVWGGDALARYGKSVQPGQRIGESWEISDRTDAQSIVANGALSGRTLHQLVETLGEQLLGSNAAHLRRFPLLVKILDARERLSLQVHPPSSIAPKLKGESKTEMWYILDADPDAHLIAGLKRGVTKEQFEAGIQSSQLEPCVHRFSVKTGDVLFVPSGRLHAIDAGLVIVEIQQNSDTTYRVYDWGRTGRALHVAESLASIDFNDFEPELSELPVKCDYFRTELVTLDAVKADRCDGTTPHILCCVAGEVDAAGERLKVGEFVLLPAALGKYIMRPRTTGTKILKTTIP